MAITDYGLSIKSPKKEKILYMDYLQFHGCGAPPSNEARTIYDCLASTNQEKWCAGDLSPVDMFSSAILTGLDQTLIGPTRCPHSWGCLRGRGLGMEEARKRVQLMSSGMIRIELLIAELLRLAWCSLGVLQLFPLFTNTCNYYSLHASFDPSMRGQPIWWKCMTLYLVASSRYDRHIPYRTHRSTRLIHPLSILRLAKIDICSTFPSFPSSSPVPRLLSFSLKLHDCIHHLSIT